MYLIPISMFQLAVSSPIFYIIILGLIVAIPLGIIGKIVSTFWENSDFPEPVKIILFFYLIPIYYIHIPLLKIIYYAIFD